MKKNKIFSLTSVLAVTTLICGCASTGKPVVVDNHEDIAAAVRMEPALVKPLLDIGRTRVTGKGEAVQSSMGKGGEISLPGIPLLGNGDAMVEQSTYAGLTPLEKAALKDAIENACRAHKCQYLLAPRYEIRTVNTITGQKATCTVTGFTANVRAVVLVNGDEPVQKTVSATAPAVVVPVREENLVKNTPPVEPAPEPKDSVDEESSGEGASAEESVGGEPSGGEYTEEDYLNEEEIAFGE